MIFARSRPLCQFPATVTQSLMAEAVWKRAFLLFSLNSQEMLDEAFH